MVLEQHEEHKAWKNLTEKEISCMIERIFLYTIQVHEKMGIFPHLCLLSHSCDPNIEIFNVQDKALLKAKRPIKKGEEICTSYVLIQVN